ncbi:MAG: hypothetical protein MUO80_05280 [Dehalococcoidia bacterium]|nr:hypothetical protein [Dehalococcoidia bacterium]
MWDRQKKFCLATAFIIASLLLCFPSAAIADGGLVLSDSQLWARMEEGQQTAVVTLKSDNTVDVDLFVSLLDTSGQSHEVVFFVPLGTDARHFNVTEKTSLDFDEELIQQLDEALRKEARSKVNAWLSLLSPTLLTSGGWMLAICFPLLLSGCGWGGGGTQPEETYETESSRVDIYGLDEDTDLEALINTTGLDPSVRETLSRLTGQRIAIVTLETQPPLPDDGEDRWYEPTGQPGIHLAWTTALVPQSASVGYSYPLGTGSSWAHPIGLTRIYVVAPPGIDFTTEYPRLGTDYSGYSGFPVLPFYPFGPPRPRIMDHYDTPAYAADETRGDFGHIWRATYTQSNSAEDVVISLGSSGGFLTTVRRSLQGWGIAPIILLGLFIALLLWVAAWRYCMPRMLGMEYRWRDSRLWRDSLTYLGINAAVVLALAAVAGGALVLAYFMGFLIGTAGFVAVLIVAALLILAALFGVPSILLFVRTQRRELRVSAGRAATAYIVVVLVANCAYLALAFGYAALAGVI